MKLADLGLTKKPDTKYKDHLYISFKTLNKDLSYRLTLHQSKKLQMRTQWLPVTSKEHFDQIMKIEAREVKA
jgi:hypothetical protein